MAKGRLTHTYEEISTTKAVQTTLAKFHQFRNLEGRNEFSAISTELFATYKFFDQIAYAQWIKPGQRDWVTQAIRDMGFAGFEIRSPKGDTLDDNSHLPIVLVEPLTPFTAKALGLDIFATPDHRAAIEEA
ncbi:MAG: CHASE domain-containing protein, partial [bacterium]